MANDDHVALLKQGVAAWNDAREDNPFRPYLNRADLRRADLSYANLSRAILGGANLRGCKSL